MVKYREVLDSDNSRCMSELTERKAAIDKNLEKQEELNINENIHTNLGKADVENLIQRVLYSLKQRKERYEKELAHEEAIEVKRKEFASTAQKFKELLETKRNAIDSLTGKI